jgi:hypothetical protein
MQTIDRIVSVMHVSYNNLYLDQNTMLCLCNVWTLRITFIFLLPFYVMQMFVNMGLS